VAAGAAAGCGADAGQEGEVRADQFRDAATAAGLAPDVVDVLATAAGAAGATYDVVYEVAPPGAAGGRAGEPSRVEYRQRPPHRRLDVFAADGTGQATISDGTSTFACQYTTEWTCVAGDAAAAPAAFAEDVVAALQQALVDGARDYDLSVTEQDVAGVRARCLQVALKPDARGTEGLASDGELCVSPEGAILLSRTATGTLRAADYRTTVADDAFDLPAPVDAP
jgi:hypothetical protein